MLSMNYGRYIIVCAAALSFTDLSPPSGKGYLNEFSGTLLVLWRISCISVAEPMLFSDKEACRSLILHSMELWGVTIAKRGSIHRCVGVYFVHTYQYIRCF